jgi:hypothetical protein
MLAQDLDRPGVEVDDAFAAVCLRCALVELVADRDERAPDLEASALDVGVAPAEPEDFSAAHAGVCGQVPRGEVGRVGGRVEEPSELRGIPVAHLNCSCRPAFRHARIVARRIEEFATPASPRCASDCNPTLTRTSTRPSATSPVCSNWSLISTAKASVVDPTRTRATASPKRHSSGSA